MMTRRELLFLLGAAGCAATLPSMKADAGLDAWLDTELGDADLAAVAAAWRTAHPGEDLRAAVLAGRRPGDGLAVHLGRKVAAEYAAGTVELVDGWYLSATEARLACLRKPGRQG